MCGIGGYVGEGDVEILKSMCDRLSHRGPDNQSYYSRDNFGFAHSRLAVIDLDAASNQPFVDDELGLVITFNGEIYNFQSLRAEILKHDPRPFRTSSDTEVIVRAYKLYGTTCFSHFQGMFALAIFDRENEQLILARDRLGKKPLYYAKTEKGIVFGSESQVVTTHPRVSKDLDPESVAEYFYFDYVPTPHSIFTSIKKLPPASILIYKAGKSSIEPYWELTRGTSNDTYSDAVSRTDELISESVRSRLVSDIPVGVFLSGGIDSSLITHYVASHSKDPVKTFAIGFAETSYDESKFARQVASHFGTDHTEYTVSANDLIDTLPKVVQGLGEPIADASLIPTYVLAEYTKRSVSVVLGGDGGDELFAGYPTFRAHELADWYRMAPSVIRQLLVKSVTAIPVSENNLSLGFVIRKFMHGAEFGPLRQHQEWLSSFDSHAVQKLVIGDKSTLSRSLLTWDGDLESRNQLLEMYLWTYLMDLVLVKVDRATMAHGLEARTPLLDHKLVEYVFSLPYHYKHRRSVGKRLLKSVAQGKVPEHIINRKKKGFGIPVSAWLRNELKPLLLDMTSQSMVAKTEVLDHTYVSKLVTEHLEGSADHRKKLWSLLIFLMWYHGNQ